MMGEIDDYTWQLELNKMEKEFHTKRQEFMDCITRYDRQSVYSYYVTEESLIEKLQELSDIKNKIQDFNRLHYPDTTKFPYKFSNKPSIDITNYDNIRSS